LAQKRHRDTHTDAKRDHYDDRNASADSHGRLRHGHYHRDQDFDTGGDSHGHNDIDPDTHADTYISDDTLGSSGSGWQEQRSH
jgi:hypothetical protein